MQRRGRLRRRSVLDDLNQREGSKAWVEHLHLITIFSEFPTVLKTINGKDLTSKLLHLLNLLTLLIQCIITSP